MFIKAVVCQETISFRRLLLEAFSDVWTESTHSQKHNSTRLDSTNHRNTVFILKCFIHFLLICMIKCILKVEFRWNKHHLAWSNTKELLSMLYLASVRTQKSLYNQEYFSTLTFSHWCHFSCHPHEWVPASVKTSRASFILKLLLHTYPKPRITARPISSSQTQSLSESTNHQRTGSTMSHPMERWRPFQSTTHSARRSFSW